MNLRKIGSLVVFIGLIYSTSYAQNFKKYDNLVKTKQYLSAWEFLDNEDSENKNPEIVVRKTELALRYFTKTYSHQKFAFSNLKQGDRLNELRSNSVNEMLDMIDFYPVAIIDSLLSKGDNPKLNLVLGDFYYDIYIRYKGYWIKPNQELMRLFYLNYKKADDQGFKTNISLYCLSLFHSMNGNTKEAFEYLKRSVKENNTYAPALYNLATMYSEIDSNTQAINLAIGAYNYYEETTYKADAARMAGILLYKDSLYNRSIMMLINSDQLAPTNYYTYNYLLKCYLAQNKVKDANSIALNMFNLDWKNHTIYNAIIEAYLLFGQPKAVIEFFEQRLAAEKFDMEYRGYVHFHLSQIHYQQEQKEKANFHIQQSRKSYLVALDTGNPIFAAVDKMEFIIGKMP